VLGKYIGEVHRRPAMAGAVSYGSGGGGCDAERWVALNMDGSHATSWWRQRCRRSTALLGWSAYGQGHGQTGGPPRAHCMYDAVTGRHVAHGIQCIMGHWILGKGRDLGRHASSGRPGRRGGVARGRGAAPAGSSSCCWAPIWARISPKFWIYMHKMMNRKVVDLTILYNFQKGHKVFFSTVFA
jgi:hypothetical protein